MKMEVEFTTEMSILARETSGIELLSPGFLPIASYYTHWAILASKFFGNILTIEGLAKQY
jgi:hypothetical protein